MAVKYNILGFFLCFLIGVIAILGTYYPFLWGYKYGTNIVEQIRTSQLLAQLTTGAKVVAMTVVGVMIGLLIHISTPVVLFQTTEKGSGVAIQGILDGIMPGLLSLGVLFLVYWLLRRKISPLVVMLILMVLTVALKTLGWIG